MSDWAASAGWYRNSAHRAVWSVPQMLLLTVVVFVLILRSFAQDPRANLKKTEALAKEMTPVVLPADDAAQAYAAASAAMAPFASLGSGTGTTRLPGGALVTTTYTPSTEDDPTYRYSDPPEFFSRPITQQYLKSNSAAIALFRAAAEKPACSGTLFPNSLFPYANATQLSDGASLLLIDARSRACQPDHAGAVDSLRAAFGVARHLETCPNSINTLHGRAARSNVIATLEAILMFNPPETVSDVQGYRKLLDPTADPYPRALRALEYTRVEYLHYFDLHGSTQLSFDNITRRQFSSLTYGSDRHCFATVMNEAIAALKSGKFPEDENTLFAGHHSGPAPMSQLLLQSSGNLGAYVIIDKADEILLIDAALAVLEFRIVNKREPRTIDELAPQFLPKVPVSWFLRKPLKLRLFQETPVFYGVPGYPAEYAGKPMLGIYSIGCNGVDDGGARYDNHARTRAGKDDQIILLRPYAEGKR